MTKEMKTPAALQAVYHYATQSHETAEDFTLPDYMPAIRRVLDVTAVPLPESRFLTGSALEFGGTLAFSVLYMGEGGELYCAPLTSEYTSSVAAPEGAFPDAAAVGMDTLVENVTCRVTAPRKLTLKCRMKTKIAAAVPADVTDRLQESAGGRLTLADEIAVERLSKTAADTVLSRGSSTAAVSGTAKGCQKVVRLSGAVRVEEATAAGGAVTVRGTVHLAALCLGLDGTYQRIADRTSFTETVAVPGAEPGDCARAFGRVASVSATPGEEGMAWEVEFDLEAESARAMNRTYTADAYSTDCASALSFRETDSLSLLRCERGALTVTGEGGRQSKPVAGETLLDARALCTPERLEVKEGRLVLSGGCAVTALLLADGEIAAEEFTLPFRYEWECGETSGELLWRGNADAVECSVRLEGDKLAATVEMALGVTALSREKIRAVETVALTKADRRPAVEGCVRVFYPDEGESLWEIAKRYGVSRQTLRVKNGLPDEAAVSDGTPVLIG